MPLTRTYTRTHNAVYFADPYKRCNACDGWVKGVIVVSDGPYLTVPCEHDEGYRDVCPSWGPVDGCVCPVGSHPEPPREADKDYTADQRDAREGAE